MSTEATQPAWADSKETWTTRVHDAVLPSGAKVTYRDLSLVELATLDELPSELLEIVVAEWAEPGAAAEMARAPLAALPARPSKKQREAAENETKKILRQIADVNRLMIAAALVAPTMTVDELEPVPMPDLEMLSALINRTLAVDAAGRRVGVVPIDQFQVVLQAHGHEQCAPDCAACETARRSLSSVR